MPDKIINHVVIDGQPGKFYAPNVLTGLEETDEITKLKNTLSDMESDGVAPSAEQLLSKNTTADAVPYHFRQTGGNGADREYVDAIVGGTVNWNQFANNAHTPTDRSGITFTNDGNSFTMNGTSTGVSAAGWFGIADSSHFSGHVVLSEIRLITGSVSGGNSAIRFAAVASNNDVCQLNSPKIVKYGNLTASYRSSFAVDPECVCDNAKCRVQVFDLTAMFGTEIADYIYSLEQATAGAGVTFFKSLFPKGYYPYDAGTLKSVEGVSEHKMVGFNQWDEEWRVGAYQTENGEYISVSNRICNKNLIRVIPNTYYFINVPYPSSDVFDVFYYDENKHFIGYKTARQSRAFTTPSNCKYINFGCWSTYGTTYNHDICINISDPAKDGTYEPYEEHSYPLDSDVTLRGIPKLDANNSLYYDGDEYAADGTVTRRYGIVDLGTLSYGTVAANTYYADISDRIANTPVVNAKYPVVGVPYAQMGDKNLTYINSGVGGSSYIVIKDTSYATNVELKAALSGVYMVYELKTPTTETADPYQHLQQCDPNGTEEFVSTGIVPVGHETRYPENLRAKIEGLPWNFASLIAPTESTFTATRNYTTGALLIVNNVLYKATANIANGGAITPNTNCTATTLAEIISALA